jgi:DedD protein
MRRRARHRLLGAAVLVLVGVVGFPLLFDTQPRPIAVDIPIEIPDRNKVKPLAVPSNPPPAPAPTTGTSDNRAKPAPSAGSMITEAADGSEIPAGKQASAAPVAPVSPVPPVASVAPAAEHKSDPAPEPKPHPKSEAKAEAKAEAKPKPEARPEAKAEARSEPRPKPELKAEAKTETKPEPKPAAAKPAAADDGGRARALLDGKNASASAGAGAAKPTSTTEESGRFVIQVGAFADADKAREVRQKLEKAGLKTYTNVARTSDGERTRVRVGPFNSRAEADRAAGRIKGLSMSAAVLSL